MELRVRFAPSPTGALHIGGVRTALYNFLLARQHGGKFILRIEDTDQSRFVKKAESYIIDSLAWLGIYPDEGPVNGGPYAPYRQSERKEIYKEYAARLIGAGRAYYAFDSAQDLEKMREELKAAKNPNQQYNAFTRGAMKNSLSLSPGEVKERISAGEPYVIRLKVEPDEQINFNDLIRGKVTVNSSTIDDKILVKSDGMPTYHLANVVDDHIMKITHVIRGEEWLPSAPLHMLLYRYFGWTETMPVFAHLPLILKPEGNGKLSKRDGDKLGFPVIPIEWTDPVTGEKSLGFREEGYLPEALVNFLALLGWNPGTEQEIFSVNELVKIFSIEKVNHSGAKFDIEKAKFFNHHYLQQMPLNELSNFLSGKLLELNIPSTPEKTEKIAAAFRERITFMGELPEKAMYFFVRPQKYDEQVIRKKWDEKSSAVTVSFAEKLKQLSGHLPAAEFKALLEEIAMAYSMPPGQVLQLLRVMVTGTTTGIDLMFTLELLGPRETGERLLLADHFARNLPGRT